MLLYVAFLGVSTCQIITQVNPSWFEEYMDKSGKRTQKRMNKEDYTRLKEMIGNTLIDCLIKNFPDISNRVMLLNYASYLSDRKGFYLSIYSSFISQKIGGCFWGV